MRLEGLNSKTIRKFLDRYLSEDLDYDSGYILGSMCTKPLVFDKKLYIKHLYKNLGDPGLFPGTAKLEKKLVSEIGSLFGGDNIQGTITTGGTEANLIAMLIAKKLKKDIKNPEVVLPMTAHVSFDKAAEILGVTLRKANLTDTYQLDIEHFGSLINNNTCAIVGIAGTTSLGLVDPIEELSRIAINHELYFHVDAAFGGFVLPFLKFLGYDVPAWDFSLPGVSSITADPHKMGLGIIPSGGLLIRDKSILNETGFEIPYLAGGNFKHFNFTGTRTGANIISFWATLNKLGIRGYCSIVDKCMENTFFLVEKICEIDGIKLASKPIMNVVGITLSDDGNICDLEQLLRKKKWMIGKFESLNLIRIVLMPHVKKRHLVMFINDLKTSVKELHNK